jgi:hypothetical protein
VALADGAPPFVDVRGGLELDEGLEVEALRMQAPHPADRGHDQGHRVRALDGKLYTLTLNLTIDAQLRNDKVQTLVIGQHMLPTEELYQCIGLPALHKENTHNIAKVIQLLSHRDYVLSFLHQNCAVHTFVFSLLGVRVFIRFELSDNFVVDIQTSVCGPGVDVAGIV